MEDELKRWREQRRQRHRDKLARFKEGEAGRRLEWNRWLKEVKDDETDHFVPFKRKAARLPAALEALTGEPYAWTVLFQLVLHAWPFNSKYKSIRRRDEHDKRPRSRFAAGQLSCTMVEMKEWTGLGRKLVERALEQLVDAGMLKVETITGHGCFITILHFREWWVAG